MSDAIDDRLKAFESKFAHDEAMAFKVTARRNKLLGLWLGNQLGKSGDALEDYAKDVVASDMKEAGDDDIVEKVMADISAGDLSISESDIRAKLESFVPEAKAQLADG